MDGADPPVTETFGFFLDQIDDIHRDRKFMHRCYSCQAPRSGAKGASAPANVDVARGAFSPESVNAASAACPKLIPPSFGGTARFVSTCRRPSAQRDFNSASRSSF